MMFEVQPQNGKDQTVHDAPVDVEQTAQLVVDRLAQRNFSVLLPEAQEVVARLAEGARITTFVPNLAERQLRNSLMQDINGQS